MVGQGWIAFAGPNGTVYTRDGRLQIAANGDLQTVSGFPVIDSGGAQITLDPNGGPVSIARSGAITQDNNEIGTIGLFNIPADANLDRYGNSGVTPDRPATAIADFSRDGFKQGYVEGSGANPMMELTKLIAASRAFDGTNSMIEGTESSLQNAIRTLGEPGKYDCAARRALGWTVSLNALRQLEWALLELQQSTPLASVSGAISEIAPTHFRVSGLSRFVRLGELIGVNSGGKPQIGEVVRIDSEGIIAKPFDRQFAGGLGSVAYRMPPLSFAPDPSWKGRVINALGAPLDGQGPLTPGSRPVSAEAEAPPAMKRARVHKPLRTGVRVIDLFAPICAGQRVGIFAGSGVGKSTLLAMLARSQGFDTVVFACKPMYGSQVIVGLNVEQVHLGQTLQNQG